MAGLLGTDPGSGAEGVLRLLARFADMSMVSFCSARSPNCLSNASVFLAARASLAILASCTAAWKAEAARVGSMSVARGTQMRVSGVGQYRYADAARRNEAHTLEAVFRARRSGRSGVAEAPTRLQGLPIAEAWPGN